MAGTHSNLDTGRNCFGGGSTTITIPGTPFQVAGTDVPCRYCRIQNRTGNSTARVRIGSACTATTGVAIPAYPTLTPYTVNNLSLLNFFGTATDVLYVEYFE